MREASRLGVLLLAAYTPAPCAGWGSSAAAGHRIRPAQVGTAASALPVLPAARGSHWASCGAAPVLRTRRRCVRMDVSTEAKTGVQNAQAADMAEEMKAALTQTAILVAAAVVFCAGVLLFRGQEDATAWFAAYILEESLSIDNLFVFSLIFDYFQTPTASQPRVLRWGLIVAVALRLTFILAGLAVVERFKGVLLLFSGVLLYSAYGLLTEEEGGEEDLSQNAVVKLTKQYLP